jgi:hypothetical protein
MCQRCSRGKSQHPRYMHDTALALAFELAQHPEPLKGVVSGLPYLTYPNGKFCSILKQPQEN